MRGAAGELCRGRLRTSTVTQPSTPALHGSFMSYRASGRGPVPRLRFLELNPHPGRPYRRPTWSDEEYAEYLRGWNEGRRGGQGVLL